METRQSICKFSLIQRHLLSSWGTLLALQLLITARKLWYISARPVIRVIPANHKLEGYDFPISSTCADKLPGRDRQRHRSQKSQGEFQTFQVLFCTFHFPSAYSCISHTQKRTNNRKNMNNLNNASRLPANESSDSSGDREESSSEAWEDFELFHKMQRGCGNCVRQKWQTPAQIEKSKRRAGGWGGTVERTWKSRWRHLPEELADPNRKPPVQVIC